MDGYAGATLGRMAQLLKQLNSENANLQEDKQILDWIEEKQCKGEYISQAIHWDGRYIRETIKAEMKEDLE